MELIGTIHGKEHTIHIDQQGEHRFAVRVGETVYTVDCMESAPEQFSILHGHASFEVRVTEQANGKLDTHFYTDTFEVGMTDPMQLMLDQAMGGSQSGAATLEAPMPGLVQRLLVAEGDDVEADQGLLVLVAMKMENELESPKAGKVKKIMVKEGDSVEGATPLVIVE